MNLKESSQNCLYFGQEWKDVAFKIHYDETYIGEKRKIKEESKTDIPSDINEKLKIIPVINGPFDRQMIQCPTQNAYSSIYDT
jgi:hypothetical protein